MSRKPVNKFTVVRDGGREKKEFWTFEPDDYCLGTINKTLHTGDYSIDELPDWTVSIERKRTVGEIYNNFFEERFTKELERLQKFKYKFLICQFNLKDVMSFPVNSGVPQRYWGSLKANSNFLMSKIAHIQIKYGVIFSFGGLHSQDLAKFYLRQVARTEGII